MARFYGRVGFAGTSVESSPGVWTEGVTERQYRGDVVRNSRLVSVDEKVNDDVRVNNSISIVADAHAFEHFFAIRYVEWEGVLWTVSNVDVQRPRLILQLGEVYNGPTS